MQMNIIGTLHICIIYIYNLYIKLDPKRHSVLKWIDWAGHNDQLKDTIEETLQQK